MSRFEATAFSAVVYDAANGQVPFILQCLMLQSRYAETGIRESRRRHSTLLMMQAAVGRLAPGTT